ncbi:unnamed protein product [Mytilus edulis]|uniref:Reverse transcriptase domain-containing protein n=1 Tax=Mytilus edulis TaxID=6550 RepID=A0A8S3SIB5_MYTED|nr:unnamed protein product [Mytilus edulis]
MAANTQQTDDELSGNLLYDKDAKVILMEILKSLRVLTDRIEKIEKEVQKIDGIKEGLSNLSTRVQTNEETIVEIQDRNSKVEESVEKMGQIFHTIVDKYSANAEEISQIKDRMETIGEDNGTSSNIAIKELKADMLDLKCRSMSDNLVFSGLAFQREESCQLKIQNFLLNELDIPYKVNLGSVHRFGKPGLNGARPIVAKFIHRDELEDVLKNTFKLKGKQFGISEQFPIEIERKRKELYPVMKKAKKEGKKVKLDGSRESSKNQNDQLNYLNLTCINCCGIKSKLKYPEFTELLYKTDIAGIVETKLDDIDDIQLQGYELIYKNRNKIGKRRSGGLAVAYKNHLKDNIEYIKTESKFVLWCKISKVINRLDDILLGIIYIPPEYTSYSSIDAINEIEMELFELSHKFSKCLLVGDFNARTGSEDDFIFVPDSESHVVDIENIQINAVCNLDQYDFSRKRNSRDKNKNRFGNQLLEFCKGNNFFIMNGRTLGDIDGKFTCRNSSVVDYCLCSAELIQNFTDFKVHDFSSLYSDVHSPIEISLKQTDQEVSTKCSDDARTNEQKINNWTNEKSYKFLECLNLTEIENINSEIDDTTVVTQETVDMIISKIGKVLINSAGNTFGFKVSAGKKSEHRKNKPWFDHDCKAARSEFRKMKRNKNKSPFHRALVSDAEKRYKNTMNKAHKKYRSDFRKKMDDLKQKDAKEFWRLLNENKSTAQPKIDFDKLKKTALTKISRKKKVHDLFNNKYKGYIDTLDKPITVDEIKDQVRTLKAGKSPGQDYISNEHILYGGENLLKHLSVLYNLILEQEYLPLSFRHGIIIPLYKGNNKDKTNPNSYRAVTLTSSLGKLFDKIILNRIHKLLVDINSVMPHPLQFGFVKEHGAIPAIYTLKEAIHYYLERNSIVYAIFLDNEKAFDRVWQDGLLYKLNQIGIQGKLWNLIYMSYKTATAHVQHSGLTSQVFRIEQGVGQGRVLSAWLFSVFINDLICELLSTHCGLLVGPISIPTILLADDTTLLSATVNGAQTLLNVVNSYALKWRLKYNASKSSVLTFTPPKRLATIMTLQHVLT